MHLPFTLLLNFICLSNTLLFAADVRPPSGQTRPLIISTWSSACFQRCPQKAYDTLISTSALHTSTSWHRLNALVEGLSQCEVGQCDLTVGYGGSPDERGETTLDSLVMDGPGHTTGAVAALRRVKSAARVAWAVINYTKHSLLVGEKATQFALSMGFAEQPLDTPVSRQMHADWLHRHCQPNFWSAHVSPDPRSSCGPYRPRWEVKGAENGGQSTPKPNWKDHLLLGFAPSSVQQSPLLGHLARVFGAGGNHDTVGMVLLDAEGHLAAGTSSNGASNKIPGRVGDSPIVGAGAYVDDEAGGAAATGDGDVMMRFLPSFLAVEQMRLGHSPVEAARVAIGRIQRHYPHFVGALVAANKSGDYGAACAGMATFGFSVVDPKSGGQVREERVSCEQAPPKVAGQ